MPRKGRELFGDAAILGGLDDRAGVLVDGTEEEIRAEVHSVIKRMGRHKFLLGADCTLPTDIDTERIRTAVRAAKD